MGCLSLGPIVHDDGALAAVVKLALGDPVRFNLDPGLLGDPARPLGVNTVLLVPARSRDLPLGLINIAAGLDTSINALLETALVPGTRLGVQPTKPSSLMISSACLGSASSSKPLSLTRTTVLRL